MCNIWLHLCIKHILDIILENIRFFLSVIFHKADMHNINNICKISYISINNSTVYCALVQNKAP